MFARTTSRLLIFCVSLLISCLVFSGIAYAQSNSLADFKADLDFIRSQSAAVLLFTPLGSNPDPNFVKHRLTEEQLRILCGGNGSCGNLGINFATTFKKGQYDKLKQLGMSWASEIAEKNNIGAVAAAINENPDARIIVRIGISGSSLGFADHTGNATDYIKYLQELSQAVGNKEFYAIAGPNEPDIEKWIAPECGAAPGVENAGSFTFYECIGPKLTSYMNAICAANLPDNIKLLSPAFNMTSYTLTGIVQSMDAAGANWSCLDGAAGNLYPARKSMKDYWNDEYSGKTIAFLQSKGLKIYITETSAFGGVNPNDVQAEPYNFDEFYIHPILGLNTKDVATIRDDLIKQGYEARCAAPSFKIELAQDGVDWMQRYLLCKSEGDCNDTLPGDDGKGDGAIFGGIGIDQSTETMNENASIGTRVISILSTDYRDSLIPVLRDVDRVPQLKRSLEDYFGYSEPNDTYNLSELNSAPINSLLTRKQRCTQSAISLMQRDVMCKKLADPTACALYDVAVPQTSLTVKELYDSYLAEAGISTDHQAVCEKIVSEPDSELRTGMLNLPLHIENAYRLAFLVTTVETRVPLVGSMMNLFQHPHRGELNEAPDPKHVVIVSAFKVPDITTNKGTIDSSTTETESGHTDFNDPALLTRDVLIPSALREKLNEQGDQFRTELLERGRIVGSEEQDHTRMAIECEIKGVGGQQCKDPLTRALVDIVNTQSLLEVEKAPIIAQGDEANTFDQLLKEQYAKLNCDEMPVEEPSYILDPGDLHPLDNAGRVFKTNFGVAILENLFTDESHLRPGTFEYDPTYADTESNKQSAPGGFHFGLKSVFHVVPENQASFGNSGEGRTVNHYIIYPTGYDQKTVEAVLAGSFFTTQQLALLRENALKYQNLQIKGADPIFAGGSINSGSFADRTVRDGNGRFCDTTFYDSNGVLQRTDACPVGSFGFNLFAGTTPESAGILGGRLGYWLHTIQQSFQRAGALTHKYLERCTSTEDFLLDQCGGQPQSLVASPADNANIGQSYCGGRTVTTLTNTSGNLVVVEAGSRKETNLGNVLDANSEYRINLAVRFVDGATLVTKNVLSGNNPGQISAGRCGGSSGATNPPENPTLLEIWRLPLEYRNENLTDIGVWNRHGYILRPNLSSGSFANATVNVTVQPGVYGIRIQGSACHMGGAQLIDNGRVTDLYSEFFIFDPAASNSEFCGKLTLNSNMPGGNHNDPEKDNQLYAGSCNLENLGASRYDVTQLNSSCGGLRSSKENDYWDTFVALARAGATGRVKEGLDRYKEIFGRDFVASFPGGDYSCGNIFPNTLQKVANCAEISNGDVEPVGTGKNLPTFDIQYWNGSEVTFYPPNNELWDAIISASNQHGCNPLLVLATAHAESDTYVNQTIPGPSGELGLFNFTTKSWTKWRTENNSDANRNHEISQCDYWQPTTFSARTIDFSSPTNVRAAVDSACRKVLWTGAARHYSEEREFIRAYAGTGENPEGEAWTNNVLKGEYVYRLWRELSNRTGDYSRRQPDGYPYESCMGEAPKPTVVDTITDSADYQGRTTLPAVGEATYYGGGIMDSVLRYRESAEINRDLIDTCEIASSGSLANQFAQLQAEAARNGSAKVVGCAAMLRLGDVRFRESRDPNDVRMVWIQRPPGAPSDIPEVIGPIAIIDVAASVDYPRLRGKGWIIDLDYHTFRRLFEWQGGWRRPQQGIRVCDTAEECRL